MSNPESRAYRLFLAALQAPEADRQRLLADTAEADPTVVSMAVEMLREYEEGEDPEPGIAVLQEWARNRENTVVAGWKIGSRVSALGGFGRVYRASRPALGGEEETAIKFLDMAPAEVPRFLRERQTLADLNHEGICKFIDGGTTEGGVPYIVMEYVSGLPITRFCDHHRKTVTERLELFVKLCHAVEYAHEHRVLHRDLKPANVLVTAAGAVRVLDFGVARLLDPGQGSPACLTKPGDAPWTKAYASPEQVKGECLSFATDVYGLGVVLYELVTGQLPFSERALEGPDWMRVICEREPVPPSHALLERQDEGAGATPLISETAAQLRGAAPSRLKRLLAGNLDAVILKALRKDPRERYQRVDRLRLDIECFLNRLPVTARRSSFLERTRNWSARHRFSATVFVASALWMAVWLGFDLVEEYHHRARVREGERVVQQLRYLAKDGLPSIDKALKEERATRETRILLAQIHRKLLMRMQAIPDYTLMHVDESLAESALHCAREWSSLGDPRTAVEVTTPVLRRVARQYELDRNDRRWRGLYSELLRERIGLHTALQDPREASDEAQRLAEIESRQR
jgi:serine/threonine protein kinase